MASPERKVKMYATRGGWDLFEKALKKAFGEYTPPKPTRRKKKSNKKL